MMIHNPINAQWLEDGLVDYFGVNQQTDMCKITFLQTILMAKVLKENKG